MARYWSYGFWILLALVVLPVWLLEYLPLVDMPLHIGRASTLSRYASDAFLQQIYTLSIQPIPNIGTDLLMLGMLKIFSVALTLKLIVSLQIVLFAIGMREIFKLFAREALWLPLLGPLLAYHSMFVYGFFNYNLGLGLFFLTFCYWYRRSTSPPGFRHSIILALLSTACYLSHLSSYAMLGVAIATILISELTARSPLFIQRLKLACAALLPMLLFFAFMRGGGTNEGVAFSDVRGKFTTLVLMLTSYNKWFDAVLIAAIVVCIAIAFISARSRTIDRQAAYLAAAFAICFAVCPATLFTSNYADARLVPMLIVMLICAVRIRVPRPVAQILIGCTLIFLSVRSVMIVSTWDRLSSEIDEDLRVSNILPPNTKVRQLCYYEDVVLDKEQRPFRHILGYMMADRDLVLSEFIGLPSQQPVVFRDQPHPQLLERSVPLTDVTLDSLSAGYNFIWAFKPTWHDDSLLASRYPRIARSKDIGIYKLRQN